MSALFDPGLQPERTELSWRRTALALGVGGLMSLRLFPALFEDSRWVIVGVVGVIAAAALWMLARRRAAAVGEALQHGDRSPLPGAALLFALAALVLLAGVAGAAIVLAAFVGWV